MRWMATDDNTKIPPETDLSRRGMFKSMGAVAAAGLAATGLTFEVLSPSKLFEKSQASRIVAVHFIKFTKIFGVFHGPWVWLGSLV